MVESSPSAETVDGGRLVATVGFALLAGLALALLYAFLVAGGTHPRLYDFHTFWLAARDYLHGRNPYPASIRGPVGTGDWFVYPAPVAALFAPLAALPYSVAVGVMTCVLLGTSAGAFWLVGVRDWRCYALAFLSLPLLKALNLGTITPLLMLAVACVWSFRNRRGWRLAVSLAAAVVLKLFLWPLLVWVAAIGRRSEAGQAVVIALLVSILAWVPVLGSLPHYPSLLHQLAVHEAWSGFGVAGLAAAAGASHTTAALVATCLAPLAALAAWRLPRVLPERQSLAVTVVVAVVVSPVVWEHYLALGSLCIALCAPALSLVWLAPLVLWAIPGQQAWGSTWRISLAMLFLAVPLLGRAVQSRA